MSLRALTSRIVVVIAAITTIQTPAMAQSQSSDKDIYWVFPGESLPGENSILPLTVGPDSGYDITLSSMDWFLLRPENSIFADQVARGSQTSSQALGFVGPKLKSFNAQRYYRLVSGMILKETLVQMGLNPVAARRYFDGAAEKGLNFDKDSLAEIGPLPAVLDNLYMNYSRPSTRLALLPYLATPLAIASANSDFRHFYQGLEEDGQSNRCDNIDQLAPLNEIQATIVSKQSEIKELDRAYIEALTLKKKSGLEKTRLTEAINQISATVESKTQCLDELRRRVEAGGTYPSTPCLNLAKKHFESIGNTRVWEQFVSQNLSNESGDFATQEQARIALEKINTRIEIKRQEVLAWETRVSELQDKLLQQNQALETLNNESKKQVTEAENIAKQHKDAQEELLALQEINFKLENGTFARGRTETEVADAKAAIPTRQTRISGLQTLIPQLLEQINVNQSNQAAVRTQVDFLVREIKANELQLSGLQSKTADEWQIRESMEELTASQADLSNKLITAQDSYTFAEFALSILGQEIFNLNDERAASFNALKAEEEAFLDYETSVNELKKTRDEGVTQKEQELAELNEQIASYTSRQGMGWYLETQCQPRSQRATDTFLSRSTMGEVQISTGNKAPGGKWGLFSMDYQAYPNSMNDGLALNLPAYIQFSVQQIIDRYDLMSQVLYTPKQKACATLSEGGVVQSSYNLMVGTYSLWQGGAEVSQDNQGFCEIKSSAANAFSDKLDAFIAFKGSTLDKTLPQTGVHSSEMTMEREAIYWLSQELQALYFNSSDMDIEARREGLIKGIIRVLANDYGRELRQSSDDDQISSLNIQLATTAPGAELYQEKNIPVGSIQTVKTTAAVGLFQYPVNKDQYRMSRTVSLDDQVKVLAAADNSPDVAVKASWLKVQIVEESGEVSKESYWMPAWPVTYDVVVDGNGKEPVAAAAFNAEYNCPVGRLVDSMTNFVSGDNLVTRLLPEINITKYSNRNSWFMGWNNNTRTSPATIGKTYIACEYFRKDGAKVDAKNYTDEFGVDYTDLLGVRIVEANVITGANGKTRYIPAENLGGYVHVWLLKFSDKKPRIIIGPQLNQETWEIAE